MKRIFVMILVTLFTASAVNAQTSGNKRNKCVTCGKLISACQYHGKHPKPVPPYEKKCATCWKPVSKCLYGGSHPKCSTCGKVVDNCQYHGNHPKCSTCGKLLDECQYGGNHLKPTSGSINGHDWVDLGLSVKWATCNVGANKPEDYGGYYAWGEIRTKSNYTWSNCFDCQDGSGYNWSVYKIGGRTKLEKNSGHDTAHENWGGSWRMPTEAELKELGNRCSWKWMSMDGHNGYVVTGPNGNIIFLPAAGSRGDSKSYGIGEVGYYWTNTLDSNYSKHARNLFFNGSGRGTNNNARGYGFSVRPVTE